MNKRLLASLLALSVSLVGACGSDDDDDSVPANTPNFALSLQVLTEDLLDNTTFVAFADDITSGQLTLDDAIEVAGGGNLWGIPGTGEYYVTSEENGTFTKFQFEDGVPVEAGVIGVLGAGVPILFGEQVVFADSSTAFLFDLNSAQALEIDLDEMIIADTFDISPALVPAEDAMPSFFGDRFLTLPNGDFVSFTYGTDFEQETVSDTSRFVFLDPDTRTFEYVDSPCGGIQYARLLDNGDMIASTDAWIAGINAIDSARAPDPCMVRIPAGTRTPEVFVASLNELTGGPTAGLVPSNDNTAFVRVLDTENFPITEASRGIELFATPAWETWVVDLDDPTSATKLERAPLAGGIKWFEVDGEVYENESQADFSSTTLVRTTGTDTLTPALTVPGAPFNILRLR